MIAQPNVTADKLDEAELMQLLNAANGERREDTRHPLFAPAMVFAIDESGRMMSAFSREISCGGIGLLHTTPVERGQVRKVAITVEGIRVFKIAEAVWCKPVGEGWFLSGWRFVRVS